MAAFTLDLMLEGFIFLEILEGRGFTSVRDCVEEEVLSIGKYVIESSEKLLKVAEELEFIKRLSTVLVKGRKKDKQS